MPRAKPESSFEAYPIRKAGDPFVFSGEHRDTILKALAKVASVTSATELIDRLQSQAIWLDPWIKRKPPSDGTRRQGLDKIVSLADDLADAISAQQGVIGADWQRVHALFLAIDRSQLFDLSNRLRHLSASAEKCSLTVEDHPISTQKPLQKLALISAHEYWNTLKVMPTKGSSDTWETMPYCVVTKIYANALSPIRVKWTSLQRPISEAVNRLKDVLQPK